MGLFKDIFSPEKAEKERFDNAMRQKRIEYPKVTYNQDEWVKKAPALKLKDCQDLGAKVNELKLLKGSKLDDVALSNGHRVDERYRDVYSEIYNEYQRVYNFKSCDPILQIKQENENKIKLNEEKDEVAKRIEDDLQSQRTIIIGVGGVVLLLGTVLILRKL